MNESQKITKDICYYRSRKYVEYITNKCKLPIFDLDDNVFDADVVNKGIVHRDKKQWVWDSVVSWAAYVKNNPLEPDEAHSLDPNFARLDFSDPKITRRVIKAMMHPLLQGSNLKLSNMNCFFVIHHGNEPGKECENEHIYVRLGLLKKNQQIEFATRMEDICILFSGKLE